MAEKEEKMRKIVKKCLIVCVTMIMLITSVMTAYAQSNNWAKGMNVKEFQSEGAVGVEALQEES